MFRPSHTNAKGAKAMPWIIGGAILGGGILGKMGQSSANRTNIKLGREQMAFQERMSNTAHTRETKDLENAGLNRILSMRQSGASTPPGALPQAKNENEVLANAAVSGAMQIAQIQNINANTAKTTQETKIITPKAEIYDEIGNLIKGGITGIKNAINNPSKTKKGNTLTPQNTKGTISKIAKHLGLSTKETQRLIVSKFKNFKGSPKQLEKALIKFLVEYKYDPTINIREN